MLHFLWAEALRWPADIDRGTQFLLLQTSDVVAAGRLVSWCDPPPNAVVLDGSADDLPVAVGRLQEAACDPPPFDRAVLHAIATDMIPFGVPCWLGVDEGMMRDWIDQRVEEKANREAEAERRKRHAEDRKKTRAKRRADDKRAKRQRRPEEEPEGPAGDEEPEEEEEDEGHETDAPGRRRDGDDDEEEDPDDRAAARGDEEEETAGHAAKRQRRHSGSGERRGAPAAGGGGAGAGEAEAAPEAVGSESQGSRRPSASGGGAEAGRQRSKERATPAVAVPTLSQMEALVDVDADDDAPQHPPLQAFVPRPRGKISAGSGLPRPPPAPPAKAPAPPSERSTLLPFVNPTRRLAPAGSPARPPSVPPPGPEDPPAVSSGAPPAGGAAAAAPEPLDPTAALRRRSSAFSLGLTQDKPAE